MTSAAGWPLVDPGIWVRLPPRAPSAAGALFLDRDGVLIEDSGYLSDPAAVRLLPHAAAIVLAANRRRIPVIVVTNQSGIARGLYGWGDFAAVDDEIARRLASAGARVDGVIACPFHPDFTPGYGPDHARFRKPAPGMIALACATLNLNGHACWMIGNDRRDCEAACAAGLAGAILLAPEARPGEPDCNLPPRSDERAFRLIRRPDLKTALMLLDKTLFRN